FSTTTGCPSSLDASCASARRCRSVDPPAGHGTISVIGLVGKLVSACAPGATSTPTAQAIAHSNRRLRTIDVCMVCLLVVLLCGDVAFEMVVGVSKLVVDHYEPLGVMGQWQLPGHADAAVELDEFFGGHRAHPPDGVLGCRQCTLACGTGRVVQHGRGVDH